LLHFETPPQKARQKKLAVAHPRTGRYRTGSTCKVHFSREQEQTPIREETYGSSKEVYVEATATATTTSQQASKQAKRTATCY